MWYNLIMKTVFTNGCFDILHRGHIDYLERSRNLGDRLIVGINSDASVRRLKGNSRPIHNEEDRRYMLQSIRWVDHVYIFDEDTPYKLIERIQPDILTKGGDYSLAHIVGRDVAKVTIALNSVKGYSTTDIIKRICDGTT
jgi:rfaE bifunctional protein nucleotidyltransferase chain/domain